jgi:heme-degrading monooxygenase HmoA
MGRAPKRGGAVAETYETWASGDWEVKEGKEEEFVERWKDWLGWSSQNVAGFVSATLIRDVENPRHFVSFSAWKDAASRDAWKNSPGFGEKFPTVRELCDEFQGGDFHRMVSL